ncbi:MAG: 2-hydroxyacid dehydrogenase [Spirochaetales bacterium]|nr:2-hydroxyacid dehydrogenase [Spirochaetales bacterium]
MSVKIAFYDSKPYDEKSFNSRNKYGFDFTFFKTRLNEKTAKLAEGFEIICAFVNDHINKETADILYNCGVKLIVLRSAGYNNVDLKAVYGRIHVMRVPAYSPNAIAEHAAALILSLNRKIHRAYYRTRDNNFSIDGFLGFDLNGKTAGVIGAGKIGRILIKILHGFGMKVLIYDGHNDPDFAEKYGAEYVDLEKLYSNSDIISLHCPLTPETEHMINAESIAKMQDGVMIINTSRGGLIDTQALVEALKDGKVGSAGLDVYEEEGDYFFEDFSSSTVGDDLLARLLTLNNVLVTSHQAFFTKEALQNITDTTLSNVKQWIDGNSLDNEICYHCEKENCPKKANGRCW